MLSFPLTRPAGLSAAAVLTAALLCPPPAAAEPSPEVQVLAAAEPPRLLSVSETGDVRRLPAYRHIRRADRFVAVYDHDEVWPLFAITSRASADGFERRPVVLYEFRSGPKVFTGFQLNVPASLKLAYGDAVALSARYLPENYLSLGVLQPARSFKTDYGTHWCREAENAAWSLLRKKDGSWLIRGAVEPDDFCRNRNDGEPWTPDAGLFDAGRPTAADEAARR